MRERLRVSLEKNSTLEEELTSTKDEVSSFLAIFAVPFSVSSKRYILQPNCIRYSVLNCLLFNYALEQQLLRVTFMSFATVTLLTMLYLFFSF